MSIDKVADAIPMDRGTRQPLIRTVKGLKFESQRDTFFVVDASSTHLCNDYRVQYFIVVQSDPFLACSGCFNVTHIPTGD